MPIHKAPQAFPREEYLRRMGAVKAAMESHDVATLVVGSFKNIAYLTGHTAFSHYVPQALIISASEEEPTFILRAMDRPAAVHLTWLDGEKVIGYPEDLIANPSNDGFDAIIDFLVERELTGRGIGIEMSVLPAEKFRTRMPNARLVNFANTVDWIRLVKSDLEIEVMRDAAAITAAAIQRAGEVIRPGVREADAVAEIYAALVRGANGKPGTPNLSTGSLPPTFLCSTPRTGTAHIPWSEDVFRDGSQVNLELSGVRHAYVAPSMRTFSIGTPSDRLRKAHDAHLTAMNAALDAVKPGTTCSDVANAFYRTLEKAGFRKESRCGYAVGLNWTEPTASLRDGDTTELKPNMTFHLMLGNWIDEDFGYGLSETFRVVPSGVEVLTNSPRVLFEI